MTKDILQDLQILVSKIEKFPKNQQHQKKFQKKLDASEAPLFTVLQEKFQRQQYSDVVSAFPVNVTKKLVKSSAVYNIITLCYLKSGFIAKAKSLFETAYWKFKLGDPIAVNAFQFFSKHGVDEKLKKDLVSKINTKLVEDIGADVIMRVLLTSDETNNATAFIKKFPNFNETNITLRAQGLYYQKINNWELAKNCFIKALKLNPFDIEAAFNLIEVFISASERVACKKLIPQVIPLVQKSPENQLRLISILRTVYGVQKALDYALDIHSDDKADISVAIAQLYATTFKINESLVYGKKAFAAGLRSELLLAILCECHYVMSNFESLDMELLRFNRLEKSKSGVFTYYKALSYFEKKQYELANTTINNYVITDALKPYSVEILKARVAEKLEKYDLAWAHFTQMNTLVRQSAEFNGISVKFNDVLSHRLNYIRNIDGLKTSSKLQNEHSSKLVFMIGFPRSGTTLLDSALRSHSKITIIEELPILSGVIEKNELERNFEHLLKSNSSLGVTSRDQYLEELKLNIDLTDKTEIIIDKLPLNLQYLHIIRVLFPEAKIILSVRHPMDCLVSNFQQHYKLNIAMAQMTSTTEIAGMYDLVMSIYLATMERFSGDAKIVKYENLVSSFRSTISDVLAFLGVNWEEGVMDYTATAKSRLVTTPSYSQVTKKLYRTSVEKWKCYEKYLHAERQTLDFWINYWNY